MRLAPDKLTTPCFIQLSLPTSAFMADLSPASYDEFCADLCTYQEAVVKGVLPKTAKTKDTHWIIWNKYCTKLGVNPFLQNFNDKIPLLQVFVARYHDKRIAYHGKPVTADTVSNVLCLVGQAFQRVGSADPRFSLTVPGRIDFWLQQQLRS